MFFMHAISERVVSLNALPNTKVIEIRMCEAGYRKLKQEMEDFIGSDLMGVNKFMGIDLSVHEGGDLKDSFNIQYVTIVRSNRWDK